ncbi:hypothetical protein BKA66DRAFT_574300 [Pyrenochaeta sp. MPI-SDFR-AT-0127]|nr:hypothetical protein BKA66DRAFT_574300 [Pyrenochaeta sp. MPI-SDFR-AT-0127]
MSIEPDLGDQRKSIFKALPAPPKTPRRVMMKYRFSAVFPFVVGVASFVLTLVVVLAGTGNRIFEEHYLIALNTSRAGRDMIQFEPAPGESTFPSSGLGGILGPLTSNLTDAVNGGLDSLIHAVMDGVVDEIGMPDFYLFYLRAICKGSVSKGTDGETEGIVVEGCESWSEVSDGITAFAHGMQSSVIIGHTKVSSPFIARLTASLDRMSGNVASFRRALFAFLTMSLTGSGLSALSAIPGVVFPHSRLLVYLNIFWPGLASVCALLAAVLTSVLNVGASCMFPGVSEAIGVDVQHGEKAVLFVWLAWFLVSLPGLYWGAVWFVEVRRSSYVRRARGQGEVGSWRGIGREVWADVTGKNKQERKVRVGE